MDKKIAGLLGAAAALTAVTGAHAAVSAQNTELAAPTTYQELLNPVANPVAALKADDTQRGQTAVGRTETAQVFYHHHHHHHHHWRRRHHHHHHHHHYMG